MRNAIVITIEGLQCGLVGAYGSSTGRTPAMDRLAAEGVLLDQCFVDACEVLEQLRSMWTGTHFLSRLRGSATDKLDNPPMENIWLHLKERQVPAKLVTDSVEVAKLAEQMGCQQVVCISPVLPDQACEQSYECSVLELFTAAAAELTEGESEGLLWIHSRGLNLPWDVPLELRREFIDPEDPDPPSELGPPSLCIDETTDPDLVVGWGQVAAAQASVIDDGIEGLTAAIECRTDHQEWAILLAATGGMSLGEHGQFGPGNPQLHAEQLQCVAICRPALEGLLPWQQDHLVAEDHPTTEHVDSPNNHSRASGIKVSGRIGHRRGELCQLPDLYATLGDLMELSVTAKLNTTRDHGRDAGSQSVVHPAQSPMETGESATAVGEWVTLAWSRSLLADEGLLRPQEWLACFQLAVVQHAGSTWVRCPAWSGLFSASGETKLYLKPDDRWEVSDVSDRRDDVLTQLKGLAEVFVKAAVAGDRDELPALDDELCLLLR